MKRITTLFAIMLTIGSVAIATSLDTDANLEGSVQVDEMMETQVDIDATTQMELIGEVDLGTSVDFSSVLDWLHAEGLTKYDTQVEFRGDDEIMRGEAAKFVNQYAAALDLEQNYDECDFTDISNFDDTLVPHIQDACGYGLLKGSDGMFMPEGRITLAQGITIVVRTLV
jgi:hypothetical protein